MVAPQGRPDDYARRVPSGLSAEHDAQAVSLIRGFAMDAPLHAKSGHQGTAMALAPLAHVLYSRVMRHSPSDPRWPNRDRFILSCGHASILQYSCLFLSGYGLSLDDIKQFRQWNSLTPGHPEAGHTVGVEVTTGPLGQGFANAVGMAIAEAHLREQYGSECQDHHTYVIAGDGCLMEGISHEAASLAGHLRLDRLVCVFDDNKITIDGPTSLTCSDDVVARFKSYGWNVIVAGAISDDLDAIESVLNTARSHRGQPTLVVLNTQVGAPSPDFTGNHEAHGNPFTADHVSRTKQVMGIPDESFWAPDDLVSTYRSHCAERGRQLVQEWDNAQEAGARTRFNAQWSKVALDGFTSALPAFDSETKLATRQAFQKVLEATVAQLPGLVSGAADLTGNTGVKISSVGAFNANDRAGRQIYFGIREHAMGAALVGMALHGGILPVGGTFFVFADYMKPAIRLAALSRAKCVFVFSHDSVGVGEDGPTHQPIEQLASLRVIPGLQVIRPADPNETAWAWNAAIEFDGPTALILSRQTVPSITDGGAVKQGAAVVTGSTDPEIIIAATGSEVSLAVDAVQELNARGIRAAAVSMPSWDRFERAPKEHRHSVFPAGVPVVSVEAGTTFGWDRYADSCVGIDRFGASAPGAVVMDKLGMNTAAVVDAALAELSAQ